MDDQRLKVLLIEQDDRSVLSVRTAVEERGADQFALDCVGTLAEGLNRLAKGDIDVVLLSLSLPDGDGLKTLSRTLGLAPSVPIVVLTDLNNEDLAVQTLRIGAQDYVLKERLNADALVRILRYTVERKRAMDEARKVTRQLASALAHDIQNPLVVINVNSQLLAARLDSGGDNVENLEMLERIQENVRRVMKLIEGFLDISKSEAQKIELIRLPVQFNKVVREVCQHQAGELALKKLSLKLNLDGDLPEVMGDEPQLERMVWNLLSNAIKYTPSGGSIALSSFRRRGQVCVAVRDTGIGIPQNELSSLFREFHRLKSSLNLPGLGLGLFIVKTIVEAHGGSVAVESEEGVGSTFTVCFPARRV